MLAGAFDDLIASCTFRVQSSKTGQVHGTGFFIAPGVALTCVHVLTGCEEPAIAMPSHPRGQWPVIGSADYTAERPVWPALPSYPDVAVIRFDQRDHPCVQLGFEWRSRQYVAAGYPEQAGAVGLSTSYADADGQIQLGGARLLKLKNTNVPFGMSGGPVLNVDTGRIVAVLIATRSNVYPQGCLATPLDVIHDAIESELVASHKFHTFNNTWSRTVFAARAVGSEVAEPPRFYGVPDRTPVFVGRTRELEQLRETLESKPTQVIVPHAAVGLGGIGKTELAVEYCHRNRHAYGFVWWVSAASRQGLIDQFVALASSIDKTATDVAADAAVRRVRDWLETQPEDWLLVIDNADDPSTVRGVLPSTGNGHVIVTSRFTEWESLGLSIFRVFPLGAPDSTELLLAKSGRTNASEALVLSDRLGGLPLALSQAGAFIKQSGWGFAQYADSLEADASTVLASNSANLYRTSGEEFTTLSVWSGSLAAAAQQSPLAHSTLEILALFEAENIPRSILPEPETTRGRFARENAIVSLASFSLIRYEGSHISLHRLVQQAALDSALSKRGLDYVHEVITVAAEALNRAFPADADDTDQWPVCAAIISHSLRLLEHAAELNCRGTSLVSIAKSAASYLNARGARKAALRAVEAAKSLTPPNAPASITAEILSVGARVERNLGLTAQAERDCRRALRSLRGSGNLAQVDSLLVLGRILYDRRDYTKAIRTFRTALKAVRGTSLKATRTEVIAINHLARSLGAMMRLAEARNLLNVALTLDTSLHTIAHADTAWTLDNLGLIEFAANHPIPAEILFRRALEIESTVHGAKHPRTAWSLRNLARCLVSTGRLDEATSYLCEALEIILQATPGNVVEVTATLEALADVEEERGNIEASRGYARRAHELQFSQISGRS